MVEFNTILSFIQATGIIVGVAYYILNIQNNRKNQELALKAQEEATETRRLQLYMQVLDKLQTHEMLKQYIHVVYDQEYSTYEEWREKYGPTVDIDAYVEYNLLTGVYQNIGYLVKSGVLDVETLAEQERPQAFVTLWEKIEPIVSYHRERFNPEAYASLEYICLEMKKLLEQRRQGQLN